MAQRKAGKAANGEGSLRQQADGRWLARLPPDARGKRPKRIFATRREAAAWLAEALGKRKHGLIQGKLPTLGQFVASWLEDEVRRRVKASTFASYKWILNRYLVPTLGNMVLDQITRQQLIKHFNSLEDQGFAAATIKNLHIRTAALLESAVEHGYIQRNPAKGIRLKPPEPRKRSLSVVEAQRVLAVAESYHNGLIYNLLIGLGLRRGEALGVRWHDINWEDKTLTVCQQVQQIGSAVQISSLLKTKASLRTLPLTDRLITLLRQHESQQREEQLIVGLEWKDHGLVFASERGTPVQPSNLNRQWSLLRKKTNIVRIALHELRHTCATLLGELEIEERVIAALLGHEPATTTARYAHVTMPMKRAAVEKLEQLLNEPVT